MLHSRRPLSSADGTLRWSNDENSVAQKPIVGMDASSKTPAPSKARRAFGDISNRKKAGGGKVIALAKLSTVASQTNGGKVQSVPETPLQKRVIKDSPATKRRVDFALPSSVHKNLQLTQPKALTDSHDLRGADFEYSSTDDIEHPAGRLWKDEQALLDDDSTTASMDELLNDATSVWTTFKDQERVLLQRAKEEQEHALLFLDQQFQDMLHESGTSVERLANSLPSRLSNTHTYIWITVKLSSPNGSLYDAAELLDMKIVESDDDFSCSQTRVLNLSF
jgi:hypothetical protein